MQVRKLHSVHRTITCQEAFPPHEENKFNIEVPESIYISDYNYFGLIYKIGDKYYHPWLFNVYKAKDDYYPHCCLSSYSGLIDERISKFWNSYFTSSPTCENWFVNRILNGKPNIKYDTEYSRAYIRKDYRNLSTVKFYQDYDKNVEMFLDCFEIKPGSLDFELIKKYKIDDNYIS